MPRSMIVTGASRGIGAATALRAARAGYRVCVNYYAHADEAAAVVQRIEQEGGRAIAVKADLANEGDIVAMFRRVDGELGTLVALVNNAAVQDGAQRIEEFDSGAMERLWAVNVVAGFVCAREAVRRMSTRTGGTGGAIVNLSSAAAPGGGRPGRVALEASKGAIDSFTRGLARELAAEGIRVNAVAPGPLASDRESDAPALRPAHEDRRARADDVAAAILWLVSAQAAHVSGAILRIDGAAGDGISA